MTKSATNGGRNPITDKDHHLQSVLDNPTFRYDVSLIDEYQKRNPTDVDRINEIELGVMDKWALTAEEYGYLSMALILPYGAPREGARIDFDTKTGNPMINMDWNASLTHVVAVYRQIDAYRKRLGIKTTKVKPVLYPYATSATFIGLQQGKSFEQIHKELIDKSSELYDRRIAGIFPTPELLRIHYNKHRPN